MNITPTSIEYQLADARLLAGGWPSAFAGQRAHSSGPA